MLFVFLGTLSFCIGVIGVFVPGLPTTPFLLLAASLYVRSSDKLYRKLISNKYFGSYIIEYRANKGLSKKVKLYAIAAMWLMICISCFFFYSDLIIKLVVVIVGLIGTIVMGFVIPTIRDSE